jgi:hypothetical protein
VKTEGLKHKKTLITPTSKLSKDSKDLFFSVNAFRQKLEKQISLAEKQLAQAQADTTLC